MKAFTGFLLFHLAFTVANPQSPILGNWLAPDMNNATIEVYTAEDGLIYGKIADCDKKEWIGEVILKKVKYDPSEDQWKGEIYSLRRKMSIDASITLEEEAKLKLVGSKFLMTKTFYWTRE